LRQPYIGGQAVMEGVMMRSPKSFVVAVRRPDGGIAIREQKWGSLLPEVKFLRWPLFRGAVVLLESLHNGFVALNFSAEHAIPAEPVAAPADGAAASKGGESSTTGMMLIALVAMVGLFIALPHWLSYRLALWFGLPPQGFGAQLLDGAMRIGLLVGYISFMARTEQARRLFAYHGAEHKAIWAYESNLPLVVENARKFPRQHPRCGTSFLFVVIFVAVAVHSVLVPLVPRLAQADWLNSLALVPFKILLAFPIAGIAYEVQKVSAKDSCPPFIRWLTAPGMWMQNLTTREPDDAQLQIAVLALERALAREEGRSHVPDGVVVYSDYAGAAAAA
jgi:uncharacterized protein YqhQ